MSGLTGNFMDDPHDDRELQAAIKHKQSPALVYVDGEVRSSVLSPTVLNTPHQFSDDSVKNITHLNIIYPSSSTNYRQYGLLCTAWLSLLPADLLPELRPSAFPNRHQPGGSTSLLVSNTWNRPRPRTRSGVNCQTIPDQRTTIASLRMTTAML